MANIYINPYGGSSGLYIDSEDADDQESLDKLLDKKIKGRFEEWSAEFIDGTSEEQGIWDAIAGSTHYYGDLLLFVEIMADVDEDHFPGIAFALDHGVFTKPTADGLAEWADDHYIVQGDKEEWAYDYVEQMGGVGELGPKTVDMYFDYQGFARDTEINGEISEFSFAGSDYVITDPHN